MSTSGQTTRPGIQQFGGRSKPVRVLVVDDSAVVRQVLSRDLISTGEIEVVGAAPDPYVARDMIIALRPQVLTLDLEMPRMDGLTFIRKLMHFHPIPTIVLSSLTGHGTEMAIEAMSAGAVDVMGKPGSAFTVGDLVPQLIQKILAAAGTRVQRLVAPTGVSATCPLSTTTDKLIAIGASTGGVQALTTILSTMPPTAPGILIVQHMPARFTTGFAKRLDQICAMTVTEAVGGEEVTSGRVLVAPGGKHMVLRRSGARYHTEIIDGPEVHHQKPAVDVLFESVARSAGRNAVGAVLTGMGSDGAKGLLAMRTAGARTLAQDEATSVVFGMPAEAINCNAAEAVVALPQVTETLIAMANRSSVRKAG